MMETFNNPYEVFPEEKFRVQVKHFHPGNSTRKERENSKYLSKMWVWAINGLGNPYNNEDPLIVLTAKCSKHDTPSRAKGREILTLKAKVAADLNGWRK